MTLANCLLVDDREENLIALEALLAGEPLVFYRARSGAEALEHLLQHDFALALVDVQMPEMDGFELAELMRGSARTRSIPIIFVTAGGPDHARLFKGYEAGAVDFLFKPLNPHAVKSKVRVFVELYQQRQILAQQVEALRESQEITKQAVEARNRFISIAGHELRTPLTVLRLQLAMAKRNMHNDPEAFAPERVERLMSQVGRQVDRLVPLVDEMLDVSRIQRGKLEIQCERFDLGDLVRDVVEGFVPMLRDARCELELEAEDALVGDWDRFRLEQVVSNLLTNASRYGGRGTVRVRLRQIEGKAELQVVDQGPGIPEADRERIFLPFERAAADQETNGLGLGLHIVRQIVEMHGGRIWVEEAEGGGACFTVRLPMQAVSAKVVS